MMNQDDARGVSSLAHAGASGPVDDGHSQPSLLAAHPRAGSDPAPPAGGAEHGPPAGGFKLRPYQERVIGAIREAVREGHRRILLSLPTGAGKTAIGLTLASSAAQRGHHTAVLVERIALADQWADAGEKMGLDCGIIQADRGDRGRHVTVYSQQTVESRSDTMIWPDERLVLLDEAHVARVMITDWVRSRARLADAPRQIVIGLTATPMKAGLGDTFTAMVKGPTTAELTADGYLLPFQVWTTPGDARMRMEDHEPTATGEWSGEDIDEETAKIVGRMPEEWERIASERFPTRLPKTLLFSSTVASGKRIVEAFNTRFPMAHGHGIAEQVSYKDSRQRRAEIIRRFRSRGEDELFVLVNVAIVGRGFDVPDAAVLIDANPYRANFMAYAQMIGRVLRPANKIAEPEETAIVLDHAGNFARFLPEWYTFFRAGVDRLLPDAPPDEDSTAWVCGCDTLNVLAAGRQPDGSTRHVCRGCGALPECDPADGRPLATTVPVWICKKKTGAAEDGAPAGACGEPNRLKSVECAACRAPRPDSGGEDTKRGWECPECGGLNPHGEYRCCHRDAYGVLCTGRKPESVGETDGKLEEVKLDDPVGCDPSVDMSKPENRGYAWAHLFEMALRNKLKRRKNVTARVQRAAHLYACGLYHGLFGAWPNYPPHMAREIDVDPRIKGWVERREAEYGQQIAARYEKTS